MKMIAWFLLGVMFSTTLVAQQPSNSAPATATATVAEPVATPAAAEPPAKATKKKAAKPSKAKPAIVEPPVTLLPGNAVVTGKNVNVRAQATVRSEAISRINQGDTVTVLEQINLDKFKPDEPRQWAKIAFPSSVDVWVHTSFIDRATMTAIPKKLNLRAGPGENFSVVGVVERGTPVKEVVTDGNWMKISAPSNAYAFVAAMYLQQQAPAAVETAAAETAAVNAAPAIAEPSTTAPPVESPAGETASTAPDQSETNAPSATSLMTMPSPSLLTAEPSVEPPPPPRSVTHEGIVKKTVSIQAPTDFALVDKDSGRLINYLYSPTTNLHVGHYHGLHIVVTGEEGLDERWKNTPVLTIKRIHVIE